MKKLIKKSLAVVIAFISIIALTACGKTSTTVKIGLNGTESKQWEYVKEQAAKEGIDVELIYFADYVQPNRALVDDEIQLNAFQTISFLNAFNKENGNAIAAIGTTTLAPMGLYSKKITSLSEISDGAEVTIPNDISNQGRALKLLDEAGLIKLKDKTNDYAVVEDIVENTKNLKIKPIQASQIPPTLDDVEFAVLNNGVAVNAGYLLTDSFFHETETAKSYINVIAANSNKKDDPTLKRIVELFQTDEVVRIINEEYKGNAVPTFVPVETLG